MKRHTINASKILERDSRATLVEWVPLKGSRANKYVRVEVGTSTGASRSQRNPRRGTRKSENNEAIQNAPSMDVDETLWMEEPQEPVIPEKKRVSSLTCPSATIFYIAFSPSTTILANLFLGLALTCIVFSILRVFQLQQHVGAACLLRLSGGALTAFLLSYSARSAAESHTSSSPSTGYRSGQENVLCRHGCGKLG